MEDDGAVGNDDDEVGYEEEKNEEEDEEIVLEEGLEYGGNEGEQDEGGIQVEEVETHELGDHEPDNTDGEFGGEITQMTVQDSLQLQEQEEPIEEHPDRETIFE